jgi:hypothetical protein
MPTPEVIDGYRGPRSEVRADRVPGQGVLSIPAGKRRFSANGLKYRLQLTNPRPTALPDGRWLDPEKAKVVVFEDGVIQLDEVKDAETIRMIEEHPYFNRDIFDVAPQLAAAEKARVDGATKTILGLAPADRELILQQLQASKEKDFNVAPKHEGSTEK